MLAWLESCVGGCRLFPSLLPKQMLESFPSPVPEMYFRDYEEPEGEDYALAVSGLLPLLLADRTRLASRKRDDMEEEEQERQQEALNLESIAESQELSDDIGVMERGPPKEMVQRSTSRMESRAKRTKLAVLVDTAIMKAMLVCPDSGALLQFVKNENSIDLVEGERSLKPAGDCFRGHSFWQKSEVTLFQGDILSFRPCINRMDCMTWGSRF